MVQALCFSVSPPRLSIVADPEREDEARELARRLWAGKIRVNLTVSPSARPLGVVPDDPTGHAGPVVRLPALLDDPSTRAMAIVRLRQSDRLLYVPRSGIVSPDEPDVSHSGAYRIRRSIGSSTTMVTNLAAAVYGSPEARSDALLRATAGNLRVRSAPPPVRAEERTPVLPLPVLLE